MKKTIINCKDISIIKYTKNKMCIQYKEKTNRTIFWMKELENMYFNNGYLVITFKPKGLVKLLGL